MEKKIKYVHTNLIARDWKKLARFYIEVFGCTSTYPERDLSGPWIEKMTGIAGVRIRGVHLKLPGYENGPTLEIFSYQPQINSPAPSVHQTGFGHIAFHVDEVEEILQKVVDHGGSNYGEKIEAEIPGAGFLEAVYARDPEGNIIEIQHWTK